MSQVYTIGQLSKLADCKVPTIRWYEDKGLLPAANRSEGNQRRYSPQHLMTLKFIRHARALGFDLPAIQKLLTLNGCCYGDHLEADQIAREHLDEVRGKILQLQAMEQELVAMLDGCAYETDHQCRILEVLADHSLCQHEHGE